MNLPAFVKKRVKRNVLLRHHTTLGVGGKGLYWYEPKDIKELQDVLKSHNNALPIFVIGAGSNLLIRDGVVRKLFIHLNAPIFKEIETRGSYVKAGAGVRLSRLVALLSTKQLEGYEFLAGIPGTVGGAVVTNAGARSIWNDPFSYNEMADIIQEVDVVNHKGQLLRLRGKDLKFSYRFSNLKPFIVTGVLLKLKKGNKKKSRQILQKVIKARQAHQDWRYPSAGSIFKNPTKGLSAGWLIDQCALKGARIGDAQVSSQHANFIINRGYAKSRDVQKLMAKMAKKVYNRFRVRLEPEVEFVA